MVHNSEYPLAVFLIKLELFVDILVEKMYPILEASVEIAILCLLCAAVCDYAVAHIF